jgi:hypothetical protein
MKHRRIAALLAAQVCSLLLSSLVIGFACLNISAQTPPTTAPPYLPLRYDEDWSYLQDETKRTEALDRLKFMPLPRRGWYVSLGGEARMRYETFRNVGFGAGTQDENGYALQRYLLHADVHFGKPARAFIQLQSGLEVGRNGGPRPTDENRLDVHQAFVDFNTQAGGGALKLRLGRQEVEFGSARLISASEALNVRRGFDGARAIWQRGKWAVNVLAVKLTASNAGFFDDKPETARAFWGAGVIKQRPTARGGWSLYYLGLDRQEARFAQGTGREVRHTLGSRFWGARKGFDYNYEGIGQWGGFGTGATRKIIRAYALATDTGYTLKALPFTPRVGLRAATASGDRNPNDAQLNSFNPLFPGTAYSGAMALVGPVNTLEAAPTLRAVINERLMLAADSAFYWRQRSQDGLYGINVNLQRAGQASRARFIGVAPAVRAELRMDRHWSLTAMYGHFFVGRFLRETPPGQAVDFFSTWLTFRF